MCDEMKPFPPPLLTVGIATDYGLDVPGSNPDGDEIFRPSRPALGPTQPPVHTMGTGSVPGGKVRAERGVAPPPPFPSKCRRS